MLHDLHLFWSPFPSPAVVSGQSVDLSLPFSGGALVLSRRLSRVVLMRWCWAFSVMCLPRSPRGTFTSRPA